MAIEFLDESKVTLTEFSELVITEYIYDPDPSKSKMALNFALGTTRFLSGNPERMSRQNLTLKTPSATVAVRGTSLSCTVDELGRTLVVNLPYGPNELQIGEIEVITAAGSVILDKPFQATTVDVIESQPTTPRILDLTLSQISNMLIINPPKEIEENSEEIVVKEDNILDFDGLDIDYLEDDFLDSDQELEFSELDINWLDINYLENVLDSLLELEELEEEDILNQNTGTVTIAGTKLGQDLDTQITTFIDGETLTVLRNVKNSARLDLDTDESYTLIIIQDGISQTIKVNGGSSSIIRIKQD